MSHDLVVPANITLLPLPAKCLELNPVENIWQFMRDNWLSNRIFTDHNDIVDHCCNAWNRLTDSPSRITSIGMRDWVRIPRKVGIDSTRSWALVPRHRGQPFHAKVGSLV